MSEFDRGVRASIVAHDVFYGVGHAVGLGLRQHRLSQAAFINELRVENDHLRAHLDVALNNTAVWEDRAHVMEADRDLADSAFRQRTVEYNELAEAYNELLRQKNEWVLYAEGLVRSLAPERLQNP